MRRILIDAEELKKTIPKFLEEVLAYIDECEEVDAIPVEWLEQMIEEDKLNDHIDEYGEYQESTTLGESCEHVLSNWYNTYKWKWEKENVDNQKD